MIFNAHFAAADKWNELFTLESGRTATLSAWGTWTWDKKSERPWCGPGGNGEPATGGSPTAGPQGSLVWRIVDVDQNEIYRTYFSSDAQTYALTNARSSPNHYQFQMNDDDLTDNDGVMNVVVDYA